MTTKTPRFWRRVGWLAAGLAIVAGIAIALVLGAPSPSVEVGRVTRGSWERTIAEDGRARVRERFVVSTPVAGVLERLTLHAGDCVSRGDRLTTVHPAPSPLLDPRSRAALEARRGAAEASRATARIAVERAEAARTHAESELARARELAAEGALPPRELEHAQLELDVVRRERDAARFAVDVAAHELEMIRAQLEAGAAGPEVTPGPFVLSAPIDGCILRVHQEDETALAPGTPVLELADPAAMEVVVDLLSTDAVLVEAGNEATLEGFGSGDPIRGRVRRVEPTASVRISALGVEEQRVDVIVDPLERTEGWARVGDGYRVDVRIPIERVDETLLVPTSALFREGDAWAVLTLEDGRARRVVVEVLRYGPLVSAVGESLPEGTTVILEPPDELTEGERVEPLPSP